MNIAAFEDNGLYHLNANASLIKTTILKIPKFVK